MIKHLGPGYPGDSPRHEVRTWKDSDANKADLARSLADCRLLKLQTAHIGRPPKC